MTVMTTENYLSSGDYLAVVRDFALSKGIPLHTLLEGSDVSMEDMINPPPFMSTLLTNRIGANLHAQLDNPLSDAAEFGLRMTTSTHGSLGLAVQCAPNLREAWNILGEFFNTRVNSLNILITEDQNDISVSLESKVAHREDEIEVREFFDLATLISIATNTYNALDHHGLSGAMTIHVNKPEPDDFPFQKIEGVNVIFDQDEIAIKMPQSWLDTPLSIANPDMAKVAVEQCESELKLLSPMDLVAKVKAHLLNSQEKFPTLEDIAQEFHMSAATFKRKLKEQATNYQALKNEGRLELAIKLMKSPKNTIETIADQLGFSDASNFTKAFKNWTGRTPKEFRKQDADIKEK